MKTMKRMILLSLFFAVVIIVSSKKGHAQETGKDRPRIRVIEVNGTDTSIIDSYADQLTPEQKAKIKIKTIDLKKSHDELMKDHEKLMKDHAILVKDYESSFGANGSQVIIKTGNGKGKAGSYQYIRVMGDSSSKSRCFTFSPSDSGVLIINGKTIFAPPIPPPSPIEPMDFDFVFPPMPPLPPMELMEDFDFEDGTVTIEEDKEKGTKRIIIEMKNKDTKETPVPEMKEKKEKKKMSNKGPEEIPSSSDLKVYPNPSSGVFNLAFEIKQKGEISVRVTDITGKEVYEENFTDTNGGYYHHSFDLRDKPDGLYIITVEQGGIKEVVRFVKES